MYRRALTTAALVVVFSTSPLAWAGDAPSVVTPAELNAALAARTAGDDAARADLRSLLARDEVRTLAARYGLDLRRAEAAVAGLEGDELHRLAQQAAQAEAALAGGDQVVISLSVVTLLLIIIIILLLA
jgi:CHASE3 domain sensor protein